MNALAWLACSLFSLYASFCLSHSSLPFQIPHSFEGLPKADRALIRDLLLLNFPAIPWIPPRTTLEGKECYDVVIIGAGMGGLAAAGALIKEGIFHLKLFDENPEGFEGPWLTYAKMKTLRSQKEIAGPALGIPHLTFHAWFEASFGKEAWRSLGKIPTALWMEYLKWYKGAMQLPVENQTRLLSLRPTEEGFELDLMQNETLLTVEARKVILATGRAGFGGPLIPDFARKLPKRLVAHTMERIDFTALKGKSVAIVGAGASSFDAAASALENGAHSVDLIMRRAHLPSVNKFAALPYKGFNLGFFHLSDEKKWAFMCTAFASPIPPPKDSLKRVEPFSNFTILANRAITSAREQDGKVWLETSLGALSYDFVILGTGFDINLSNQPELACVSDEIALWKDRLPEELASQNPKLASSPYLGPAFQFLPKPGKEARYLKNLYCFNYAATLSHGLLSSDIPAVSIGATRLAEGIAQDFFAQESAHYLEALQSYSTEEFQESDFSLQIQPD